MKVSRQRKRPTKGPLLGKALTQAWGADLADLSFLR